ncbi:hypothetical protein PGTUg99_034047 [Puccinia graminis f. sp. tritici]|uniref:Tyr recombinase domain-containing protein n=3 Tax=Puccinia graminis f. sp. tritici TaxID=56615 RepID=E3KEP7_PUCGT|nr:uncharacterized protein PGTG_08947 [Puccinia graminis f. sp. tritici CRL 75-36-700-3]EFP82751.1 hypothetical protein PGTG_08947 [Puccinia graminis f. sp. tritici CRL 75-36-700-3]KAA1090025.1 hypothetical protein PGTUg99_034047 [Puccinia graminis f. sp. tritici]
MVRLGDVTLNQNSNEGAGIYIRDVLIAPDGASATIELRRLKTAAPGESQFLKVKQLPNILCPVKALGRCIKGVDSTDTHLFSVTTNNKFVPLTKYRVKKCLSEVWQSNGYSGLLGHSFRVGGAPFLNALGVPINQICLVGRWSLSCYKLYSQTYLSEELDSSLKLLGRLDLQWKLMRA